MSRSIENVPIGWIIGYMDNWNGLRADLHADLEIGKWLRSDLKIRRSGLII